MAVGGVVGAAWTTVGAAGTTVGAGVVMAIDPEEKFAVGLGIGAVTLS